MCRSERPHFLPAVCPLNTCRSPLRAESRAMSADERNGPCAALLDVLREMIKLKESISQG